jgi:hypothetical protein
MKQLPVSITDIPRKVLLQKLYGRYDDVLRMQMEKWLNGKRNMPVHVFWEICLAFPYIDVQRSLQDIYDRHLVRRAKDYVNGSRKKNLTTVHVCDMATFITGVPDHERIRQATDGTHAPAGHGPERRDRDRDPSAGD